MHPSARLTTLGKALGVFSLSALLFVACGGSTGESTPDDGNDNLPTAGGDGVDLTGGSGSANGGSANGDGTDAAGDSSTGASTSAGTSTSDAGAATTDPGGVVESACGDQPCACNNGIDDDGDGKIDGFDEECTGALDDDEGTFATGIPGDNVDPKWQDCFFDGNSGAGDDGCRYHTECLTGDREASDPSCELTQACIDFCRPLTPNGCDCFGCCTIDTDDGPVDVVTVASCSLENVDDEEACPRCVKSAECDNECGECELCPGKTVDDLPDSCTPPDDPGTGGAAGAGSDDPGAGGSAGAGSDDPGDPGYTCDEGVTVCTSNSDCPSSYYCQLGCCLAIVF